MPAPLLAQVGHAAYDRDVQWLPFGWLWVGVSVVALGAAACGRTSEGAPASPDRALARMRADIAALQSERERMAERLSILEMSQQRRVQAEQKVPDAEAPQRLPVVHIGREGAAGPGLSAAREGDDTRDAPSGRPMLQASGSAGRLRHGSPEPDASSDTSAPSAEARHSYEAALALFRGKRFDAALQAFTSFLVRYPDHPSSDAAMYFRGECLFAQGDIGKAEEQYEGLLARFPFGNKTPDALLKVGLCQRKLGASALAERTFADLRERYPNSEAARQVPQL